MLPGGKNFVPYQCPSPKMAQKSAGAFIDNFLPRLSGLYNRWRSGGEWSLSTCYCAGTEHPTMRWRTWITTTTTPPTTKHGREAGSGAAWWRASGTSSSSTLTLRESIITNDNNNRHQPPPPPSQKWVPANLQRGGRVRAGGGEGGRGGARPGEEHRQPSQLVQSA